MSLDSLGLSPRLVSVLHAIGIAEATPIQAAAIPTLLAGKDLLALSPTGSGKTLAFALPILDRIDPGTRALSALVLCPTRELAAQVAREFRRLGRDHGGLRVVVLAGGEPIRPQADSLARGAHVAVGTPGRLIDLLQRKAIRLDQVRTVVLDEADRMLDMGFRADVETILRATPKARQTALFSATFPDTIGALSRAHQREPERITVADDVASAPDVRHRLGIVPRDARAELLVELLGRASTESAIVFCNQKATVAELEGELRGRGVSVAALHGDLEQFDRDRVLARFRNGSVRVLVATDVAARGIDVADLDLVVNFDLPNRPEDYVHRVGRTARAGKQGEAWTFAASGDATTALAGALGIVFDRSALGPSDRAAARRPAPMATLFVTGGRKDKVRPADLLGALTGDAGLAGGDVGKIEIHDAFAYVAVARAVARQAHERLSNGTIKGRRFRVTLLG